MKETSQRVQHHLKKTEAEHIAFLTELVGMETPTDSPDLQRRALIHVAEELDTLGFRIRYREGKTSGGQLIAIPKQRGKQQAIQLLIGHTDTVWPQGSIKKMPIVFEGNRMKGPGVFDMKAGISMIVYALRCLKELQLDPEITPVIFINTDEETGSHDSIKPLCRLARIAERAYVMEPALGMTGKLKTARKGVGHYTIEVKGTAAHAGLNPQAGASAILELSHVIQTLFAMNDHEQGVTINVGTIDGGLGANIVAPHSSCQVDVRVPSALHAAAFDHAIRHQLEATTEGVELLIRGGFRRPPLERNAGVISLWQGAREAAAQLGFELEEGMAGGGSDGNHCAQLTPTLDGLGAVGDGAHAHHEFIFTDKLQERTALLALLLLAPCRIAKEGEEACKVSSALH